MSNCESCGSRSFCHGAEADCGAEDLQNKIPLSAGASVRLAVGMMGANGGVGTTLVTALLAKKLAKAGYRTAVLDADVPAPDIAAALNANDRSAMQDDVFLPTLTDDGIQVMSFAGFMSDPTEPMLWGSRMMADVTDQFWGETLWEDVDILLVDLPSGAGDPLLNIFNGLPLSTSFLVSTTEPHTLVRAEQARNTLDWSKVRCAGLIINEGGTRGTRKGDAQVSAIRMGLPLLDSLPLCEASEDEPTEGLLDITFEILKVMLEEKKA